ncbi:MAG: hypothetical protein JJE34_10845 [Alphaproteobacteria bacterium]|nr:hypothetical protein [Alphaproteobacteria bacterium]
MVRDNNANGARNETLRFCLLALGLFLIMLTPVVGALPGPGGIVVLIGGLALTLRNSKWAKRLYVRFKKRWPRYGHWADRGLRRKSHFRRQHRKAQQSDADD